MAESAKTLKVQPLGSNNDFGAEQHKVPKFSVNVSGGLTKKDLEDVGLWVNFAKNMTMGCEVRCLADDMSFVAYGICTFVQGTTAKIKIITMHKLDAVDYEAFSDEASDFEAKLCGPKKWCIIKKSTGEYIREGISTQLECLRDLEDYKKALRS